VVASAEAPAEPPAAQAASQRSSQVWAMLIKRALFNRKPSEVDPLCCPECGGQMKVISFIEPPQTDVIEAILKHCGRRHRHLPGELLIIPDSGRQGEPARKL